MRRILRLGKGYAFAKNKLKYVYTPYTGFLAVLMIMCLQARAQQQEHFTVTGKVISAADGRVLEGATIVIKDQSVVTITDDSGTFGIKARERSGHLIVTYTGYEKQTVPFSGATDFLTIRLVPTAGNLDEVVVIGYGQTSKRFNTGSVSSVSAKEIGQQPVTNVLSALSGRMPGVFVQTTNGLPGGNINIEIRGKGSMLAGTLPLYIIDGVPLDASPHGAAILGNESISGGVNPLNSLNPADIASITVLKDADATAIYGSRGSNGVVLIETKRSTTDNLVFSAALQQGASRVVGYPDLMDVHEYLRMRRQAFENDGMGPSADPNSRYFAPDLTVWDTTRTTDWVAYLLGGTASVTDGSLSMQGRAGDAAFEISGNFRNEGTVLPGDSQYKRGGLRSNLRYRSPNQRFSVRFANILMLDNNDLANPVGNFSSAILLPPHYPAVDTDGNYDWYAGANPVAELNARSKTQTNNHNTNLRLDYETNLGISIGLNMGYNRMASDQRMLFPSRSLYPGYSNYSQFGKTTQQSMIVEPLVNYTLHAGRSRLTLLGGGTYQHRVSEWEHIKAENFSHEGLLENIGSAALIPGGQNTHTTYRYASVFGRATYHYDDKYLVNLTARRDGSSRFGPGKQFGTFASAGLAWVFSRENFVKNGLKFISFGKIRLSYGTTGNDQIADYQYLATYGNGSIYMDKAGLRTARIANADLRWELTRKMDMGIEINLFNDRLSLQIDRYRHRSTDQLVSYALPAMTGFTNYQANIPAVVQNTGTEVSVAMDLVRKDRVTWVATANATFPKNELISFENFEESSYALLYRLGEDISRIYGYHYLGVGDNGKAVYADEDGGDSGLPYLFHSLGYRTPTYYGGVGTDLTVGNWQFSVFGQFAKKQVRGGLYANPGWGAKNSYSFMMDNSGIPAPSIGRDSRFSNSSINFFDVSYFRLKNVAVNYTFREMHVLPVKAIQLYAQGHNLLTMWQKDSAVLDPESGAYTTQTRNIPPMRTFVVGLKVDF